MNDDPTDEQVLDDHYGTRTRLEDITRESRPYLLRDARRITTEMELAYQRSLRVV